MCEGDARAAMKKILIADDHALIRDGIASQLRSLEDVTTVQARDWNEVFAATSDPQLELAIVDLRMPGRDGMSSLAQLLRANPGLPVLVLSASEAVRDMREALQLGAMGYVNKSEPSAVLLAAIRLVLEGGMYIPPALAGMAPPAVPSPLSERQLDVLRRLVEGRSNEEIALELHIARATVKVHVAAILRALGVANRTQAAVAAERLGLHHPRP